MGRHRRGVVGVATGCLVVALCAPLSVGVAHGDSRVAGAAAPRYHLYPVAGTNRFLAYTKFRVVDGRRAATGGLYVLNAAGRSRRLGSVTSRDIEFSMSGPMIYAVPQTADGPFVLWNAAAGTHRTLHSPYFYGPITAAPHGYIAVSRPTPGPASISVISTTGEITALGTPFPKHYYDFGVTVSSTTFVVFKNGATLGGIKVGRFSEPGHFHTVLGPAREAGAADCGAPSARYVACGGFDGALLRLFKLSAGQVAATSKHACWSGGGAPPAALGASMVWVGCSSRLWQLDTHGRLRGSRKTFPNAFPIIALHQVVLDNHSRSKLLGLTSATAKPRVLVSLA